MREARGCVLGVVLGLLCYASVGLVLIWWLVTR